MAGRKTILSFGETLWDLLPSGRVLGGAPCNFAYRIQTLGNRGVLVTRLGRDDLGRAAFDRLRELGMETGFVQWDDRLPTGTVRVRVDPDGTPDFTILRGVAYDAIEGTESLRALAAEADGVCFGTLVQRAPVSRGTLESLLGWASRAVKILDLNLRKDCHSRETIERSLARADILKLNDQEAFFLKDLFGIRGNSLPGLAEALVGRGRLTHVVITLGARGALAVSRGGERVYDPGYAVEVVDTCGSGDAFAAGFFHSLLEGGSLAEACRLGNVLGAMVAAQAGATGPVSPEAVEAFRASERRRVVDSSLEGLYSGPHG